MYIATFSYPGGTVLAGLLDGALAGQMGIQSMRLLRHQIQYSLDAWDAGFRKLGHPKAIGWLPPFEGDWTVASQVQRLRDGVTQLTALIGN